MLWTAGAFGVSGCQCRRTVTRQVGQVSTIVDGTGIQGSGPRWHVLAELHGGDGQVYDVAQMGRLAFPSLFMGMDILTKEGRIPSELVHLAIAWGQGVAAEIEALFCPNEREEPPEGGPAQM